MKEMEIKNWKTLDILPILIYFLYSGMIE